MIWLKEIRKSQKKSQQECADAIGVTQQMFSCIENGRRKPHYTKAQLIAEYLNFQKYGLTWTAFFEKQNTS